MIYFFILLPLLGLAATDCAHVKNVYRTQISRAILLALVLFAGLRNETGTDWIAYREIYSNFLESARVEVLYRLLNNGFSSTGIHYNSFLLCINLLSLSLIVVSIRSQSKYFFVALLIYFCDLYFYYNLSGQRQAVAFGLTTAAIALAANKKHIECFCLILIATGFHITALTALLVLVIPREQLRSHHLRCQPS